MTKEHKTRKDALNIDMACPGPYDAFWTFPRTKSGYSGVCTYVDSRYCVPLKAEEGITGHTLHSPLSVMKPAWSDQEKIGGYPQVDQVKYLDEIDGRSFEVKTLDFEGRAIVLDFGYVSRRIAADTKAFRVVQPVLSK
jgi:AP endonuclease-2